MAAKKCVECRHYFNQPTMDFKYGICLSEGVLGVMVGSAEAIDINHGRKICDKEGDGRFVFFEPIEPTAGATFIDELGNPNWDVVSEFVDHNQQLVQITRERSMAAGGAV